MNFATAKTAVRIGMQVRFIDEYGAFPHHVPAGATGTVVDNRLDAIDPVIQVTLDDPNLTPWGRLDIRGPEEAFPVDIKELARAALDYDPTDKRNRGREAERDDGRFVLDETFKIGRWGNPVPFEIVDPPTSPLAKRLEALQAELEKVSSANVEAQMSNDRYATSGQMGAFQKRLTAIKAAINSLS